MMSASSKHIPKDKLLALLRRKLERYEAEEHDARNRQKHTKDHEKRLLFREEEFMAQGKVLAVKEIMTDIMEFARQI